MTNIIFEGDTMKIVNVLRMKGQSLSRYSQLIDDANTLHKSLKSWYVRHAKRKANMTVHYLAIVTIQQSLKQIWVGDYSTFIHANVIVESVALL
jgi:hypothetical protein